MASHEVNITNEFMYTIFTQTGQKNADGGQQIVFDDVNVVS